MAITKIWAVHRQFAPLLSYVSKQEKTRNPEFFRELHDVEQVLEYVAQEEKTEQSRFVSGIHCDPELAYEQMQITKQQYQKTGGILAFHGIQSFAPGEVTPEQAHEIGMKLAQELWGNRFQVVVATHLDRNHLHNHFAVNSVSFLDGKKFYADKASYSHMRKVSDRLCKEYALSVIGHPTKGTGKHYTEWKAEQEGRETRRGFVRQDVDQSIAGAMTLSQFLKAMREKGYEVKMGERYLSVRPQGKKDFIILGKGYSENAIKQRILANHTPSFPARGKERKRYVSIKGDFRKKNKVTGIRALYFHYLYRMGILPKNKKSRRPISPIIREDRIYVKKMAAEITLLHDHKIQTTEQLVSYQSSLKKQIETLDSSRKAPYHQIRRCSDEAQKKAYYAQVSEISDTLKPLRKEVKTGDAILRRTQEMRKKLHQAETEQRKERTDYEHRSRGRRPTGEHDLKKP